MNYDLVDIKDINFYLYDRINRKHYLTMIPVLIQLRDYIIAEQQKEKAFINLLCNNLQREFDLDLDSLALIAEDCVETYKKEVKWKRSIEDNDEKSWRIISNKIRFIIKNHFS